MQRKILFFEGKVSVPITIILGVVILDEIPDLSPTIQKARANIWDMTLNPVLSLLLFSELIVQTFEHLHTHSLPLLGARINLNLRNNCERISVLI